MGKYPVTDLMSGNFPSILFIFPLLCSLKNVEQSVDQDEIIANTKENKLGTINIFKTLTPAVPVI